MLHGMFWIACRQSLTNFMWSVEDRPKVHGFVGSSQKKWKLWGHLSRLTPKPVLHASIWMDMSSPAFEGDIQDHKTFTGNLLWGSCRYQGIERNCYHWLFKSHFRYNSFDSSDAVGFRNSEQPSCGATNTRCRQQVQLVIKRCANWISFKRSERAMAHYCYNL